MCIASNYVICIFYPILFTSNLLKNIYKWYLMVEVCLITWTFSDSSLQFLHLHFNSVSVWMWCACACAQCVRVRLLYLGFAGWAAGVEDEERIFRVAPLWLALVWSSTYQSVPTQVHLGVPWDLQSNTQKRAQTGQVNTIFMTHVNQVIDI